MSNVSAVTNHFPTVNEGFITTTTGAVTANPTIVPLASVTGLTNGSVFIGIINPSDATKKQTFTGVVDTAGSRITDCHFTRGTSLAGHASGTTVIDYITGTALNMITKGMRVQHKQDGTHSAVTADSLAVAGASTLSGGLTVAGAVAVPDGSVGSRGLTSSYVFRAIRTTNVAPVGNATWSTITFPTVQFNVGSCYSGTTGKFTAAIAGYYQFNASLENSSPWGNLLIGFNKNGNAETSWGTRYLTPSANASTNFASGAVLHHSDILHLSAGDTVEVQYYSDDGDGVATNPNGAGTWFSGFLVAAG